MQFKKCEKCKGDLVDFFYTRIKKNKWKILCEVCFGRFRKKWRERKKDFALY